MSKKTLTHMETVLMDRIEKAHLKLNMLQQKQNSKSANLPSNGLHQFDMEKLNIAFACWLRSCRDDCSAGNTKQEQQLAQHEKAWAFEKLKRRRADTGKKLSWVV